MPEVFRNTREGWMEAHGGGRVEVLLVSGAWVAGRIERYRKTALEITESEGAPPVLVMWPAVAMIRTRQR